MCNISSDLGGVRLDLKKVYFQLERLHFEMNTVCCEALSHDTRASPTPIG